MKILYLINYAGKAGTEKYVENLVRIFSDAGHECHFAYCVPGELSEKMAARGVPSLRLDLGRRGALTAPKRLARYCEEHGIEVIHAQYPAREHHRPALPAALCRAARGVYQPPHPALGRALARDQPHLHPPRPQDHRRLPRGARYHDRKRRLPRTHRGHI